MAHVDRKVAPDHHGNDPGNAVMKNAVKRNVPEAVIEKDVTKTYFNYYEAVIEKIQHQPILSINNNLEIILTLNLNLNMDKIKT